MKNFFAPENIKKLHTNGSFFSAAPTAQTSPELKIHIKNVAQDISVYYSVVWVLYMQLSVIYEIGFNRGDEKSHDFRSEI